MDGNGVMSRSPEYYERIKSKAWRRFSNMVISLSEGRCSLLVIPKATHCHHMTYSHLGHELPLVDCVPLSPMAHKIIHWPIFWKTSLRVLINWWLRFVYLVLIIVGFVLGFILLPVTILVWILKLI